MTDALVEHADISLRAEYDSAERSLQDIAARMRAPHLGPGTIEVKVSKPDIARHLPAWKRLEEAWLQDPLALAGKYLRFKGK